MNVNGQFQKAFSAKEMATTADTPNPLIDHPNTFTHSVIISINNDLSKRGGVASTTGFASNTSNSLF